MKNLRILKFGGTSMGNANSIRQVAEIIQMVQKESPIVVVCSAVSGITNALLDATEVALSGKINRLRSVMENLRTRHKNILINLLPETGASLWENNLEPDFAKLCYVLQGVRLVGDITDKTRAYITSFGEQISVQILDYYLQSLNVTSQSLCADRLIRTDDTYLEANVDMKKTEKATRRVLLPLLQNGVLPIVTGFLGRGTEGEITLLGRGGSDYTAGLLGLSLKAVEVQIWTDVSGIYSADPKYIQHTKRWDTIDLSVMSEMAHAGAKVLHPKSICAAVEGGIPVQIKNTFAPKEPGTTVMLYNSPGSYGINAETEQVILHLENPKMLDSFGFVEACSSVFVEHKINIDTVSTSEISISISLSQKDITKDLIRNLEALAKVKIYTNVIKISVIGQKLTTQPKVLSGIYNILSGEEILSQCANAGGNTLTILLQTSEPNALIQRLHNYLFS